jgi:hypothetical protein
MGGAGKRDGGGGNDGDAFHGVHSSNFQPWRKS